MLTQSAGGSCKGEVSLFCLVEDRKGVCACMCVHVCWGNRQLQKALCCFLSPLYSFLPCFSCREGTPKQGESELPAHSHPSGLYSQVPIPPLGTQALGLLPFAQGCRLSPSPTPLHLRCFLPRHPRMHSLPQSMCTDYPPGASLCCLPLNLGVGGGQLWRGVK